LAQKNTIENCYTSRETRRALVADPFLPNPMSDSQHYGVAIDRLVCAILLGILTYDGDLLIIQPKRKRETRPDSLKP